MTTFAFVPRTVQKYTKEWQGISRPSPSPSPPPDPTTDEDESDEDDHDTERDDKPKGGQKTVEPAHSKRSTFTQDIPSLISLALSDHNIWLDPDLRWKLDACLQDDISPNDSGFVPINYLLRRPPFRGAFPLKGGHPEPSETDIVKALRAHASRTLEVRLRLPHSTPTVAPASSVWYGTGKTSRKKDVGGYEVRRRDWATLRYRPSRGWTRVRWDDVTAYMECIPPQYRSVGGIARFTDSLLSETKPDVDADVGRLRIQCVTLPPHYLDKPGDLPKCKGYALVTFSTKSDLEAIVRGWPWRRSIHGATNDEENTPTIVKEALKYGLRAISKARWDALNEEYLVYKQSLVDERARAEAEIQHAGGGTPDDECDGPTALPSETEARVEMEMRTAPSSPYPFDCLVFVRNVHPDTNKTMLKSLFGLAFHDQDQDQSQDRTGPERGSGRATTGLDYVDFNKGMDTCYLRLASPSHTTRLLAYFTVHPTVQAHGLDDTGRTPLSNDKPIIVERVQGRKEEVYWEGIPDKVRRQAVEKVIQTEAEVGSEMPSAGRRDGASGSRRKKRTRE